MCLCLLCVAICLSVCTYVCVCGLSCFLHFAVCPERLQLWGAYALGLGCKKLFEILPTIFTCAHLLYLSACLLNCPSYSQTSCKPPPSSFVCLSTAKSWFWCEFYSNQTCTVISTCSFTLCLFMYFPYKFLMHFVAAESLWYAISSISLPFCLPLPLTHLISTYLYWLTVSLLLSLLLSLFLSLSVSDTAAAADDAALLLLLRCCCGCCCRIQQ